ncbi:MAG: DUF1015 domain-containing protein [bacterium]
MPRIKAFEGYLIKNEYAAETVAPEYDTVPAEQRRAFADANPDNFINTMRLREDFNPASPPSPDELLEFNRRNLQRLLKEGFFSQINKPCIYIYQLIHGQNEQTGVVCEISADEYEHGHVRKHENTRRDREDLLAHYQKVVGVASCPISLAYPENPAIDEFIKQQVQQPPMLDFTTGDDVHQRVWCIEDNATQQQFSTLFEQVENTYLTDGHHRAASGWRYAEMMRESSGNTGDEPYNQLLVALFSDHELNLLPFHRCVRDFGETTPEEFLNALDENFEVSVPENQDAFEPDQHGEFGMFLDSTWFRLRVRPEIVDQDDPVASLDVSILQDRILGPLLDIHDFRSDPRLGYVPGVEGKEGLEQKVREGWAVSFACFATSMDQLMHVADAHALMPPKSTYFDPKTRSGVFVRLK